MKKISNELPMEFTHVEVSKINPHPANWKKHPAKQKWIGEQFSRPMGPGYFVDVVQSSLEIAKYWKVPAFGFQARPHPANSFQARRRAFQNAVISEKFVCFLKKDVRYDERFFVRVDVDIMLKLRGQYGSVLKVNPWAIIPIKGDGRGEGGLREKCSRAHLEHDNRLLVQKYGKAALKQIQATAGGSYYR